ncbi:MAG: response regulator [Deltaproteobacteria bacterium]|nr:response regulator [Deltaproteobacteria bacterium]
MIAEFQSTHSKVIQRLELFGETFNPALSGAMWDVNEELINSTLKGMLRNPILNGVKIEDIKKKHILNGAGVFTNYSGELVEYDTEKEDLILSTKKIFFDLLSYQFDIVFKDEEKVLTLGICTVYSSIDTVLKEVQLSFIFIVVNAILKSLALWVIYLLVSRRMLSYPLARLTQATRNIRLENLEHFKLDVKTSGRNELKIMEEAFHLAVNKLLTARKSLEKSIQLAKQLSSEGRKISSCLSYQKLGDQVSRSFAKIAAKEINAELIIYDESSIKKGEDNAQSTKAIDDDLLKLKIFDTKDNSLVGEVRLNNWIHLEEYQEIFPIFQALLVNIANTRRNIVILRELEEKASDLEKSNQALSRLDRLKDEFLANTSHELRTPLNGIIGVSESLIDGIAGTPNQTQTQHLAMIVKSAKSLSNLINDLLDFSKISNDSLRLEVIDLSLHHVLDIMLTFFTPLITQKGLKLVTNIPNQLPLIQADENRLQQILFNLLGNAIKFTVQGKITISVVQQDQMLKMSIGDTGIGIPSDQHKSIFNPFEQAHRSDFKHTGGTGLGLSISKKLVDLHGGSLEMNSLMDIGSLFSFTIPISDQKEVNTKTLKTLSTIASRFPELPFSQPLEIIEPENCQIPVVSRSETVLVVDDDQLNLQVVKNFLILKGFTVLLAQDGYEALDMIQSEKPSLVLLDLMMPGLNGYDTCRQIRKKMPLTKLPVIMLTARDQVWDLVKGFECGASDYMIKPFYKEELLARINTHLEAKKATERLQKLTNLQVEIEQRIQTEKELLTSQKRLLGVLDASDSALVTVNESMTIIFFNQGAENLFDYPTDSISGKPLHSIFSSESYKEIEGLSKQILSQSISDSFKQLAVKIRTCKGREETASVMLTHQPLPNENLFTVIFQNPIENSNVSEFDQSEVSESLVFPFYKGEINRSQMKTQIVADALREVGPLIGDDHEDIIYDLRYFGSTFDKLADQLGSENANQEMKQALVDIMCYSLAYWELQEGKTKIDLAEESKIWRVYLDVGTYRTRTLDKYLKIETLPKRPKWKDIIKTAIFVLTRLPTFEPQKQQLSDRIKHLIVLSQKN